MKSSFFLFFMCVCVWLFPSQILIAKTLHAILVADTIHDLNAVTQADLQRWQKELRVITQHTQMILKEKIFTGSEFNQQKIKNYLENFTLDEQDSVVFYFSGHGYRTKTKTTPWPFMTFEFYKPGLDIQWVLDKIREKKPQFALVMSDCCNNFMELGWFGRETKNIRLRLRRPAPYFPNYQQLFCNAQGCVVVASCSAGQFSYGSRFGGLYTQCFFSSLGHELLEKNPSWKNLLQRVNGYITHIQKPVCEIYR